jgi:hypothetical protein
MDECLIIFIILFIAIVTVIIFVVERKILLAIIPPVDINYALQQIDYHMRMHRWQTSMDYSRHRIKVSRSSLVASDIILRHREDSSIEVLGGSNAGDVGWILVIICALITGGVGLVLALVLHYLSRKFAKVDILSVLYYNFTPTPMLV